MYIRMYVRIIYVYVCMYIYTVCSLFKRGDSYSKNRPYLSPTLIKRDRFYGRRQPRQAAWKDWEACAVHRGKGAAGRSSEKTAGNPSSKYKCC